MEVGHDTYVKMEVAEDRSFYFSNVVFSGGRNMLPTSILWFGWDISKRKHKEQGYDPSNTNVRRPISLPPEAMHQVTMMATSTRSRF